MVSLGDLRTGVTLDLKFCTVTTTGAPTQLAGTPAVSVYKDNSTTQSTSGVTLTVDFDSVTGLNNVRIDTSADGTFYSAGSNFQVVITTGTVGGTSVVGYVVGQFSLENRSALMPTTAGRKLDVSAGGEAGIDWANVGSPTTALNLSATNIDTDQVVASVSGAVGSVTGGVTVTTNNDKTGYALSAASIQAIWDALTSALTTASSIGKLLVDNVNATISSRLASASYTAPLDAAGTRGAVGLAAANLDTQIDALPTATENADALLKRDWTAVTGEAARSVLNAMRFLRNKWSIAGGTLTVTKEDDSTSAWSGAVTTAAGDPVSEIDPA